MLTPVRQSVPLKGMNTVAPPREMAKEYSPDLLNVWYDDGITLRRRLCQSPSLTPTTFASPVSRMFEYRVITKEVLVKPTVGGFLGKDAITGLYTKTYVGDPVFTGTVRSAKLRALQVYGDAVGNAVKFDGATFTAIATPPAPVGNAKIGNIFHIHRGRCYAAGNPAFPMTVFFSDAMTSSGVDYWSQIASATGQKGGFIDASADISDGDVITGITSHKGFLVVLCTNHVLFYSVSDPVATVPYLYKVVKGEGCVTQDSIQGVGEDTLFLSPNGFKKLSVSMVQGDSQVSDLSQAVNNVVKDSLRSGIVPVSSIVSTYNPKYGLYVCTLGAIQWVYQTQFEGWFQWRGLPSVVFTDSDLLSFTAGTQVYSLTNTVYQDTIAGVVTPVTMRWTSRPFRAESLEHKPRWNRCELLYETNALTDSIDVSYYPDLDIAQLRSYTQALAPSMQLPNLMYSDRLDIPVLGRSEVFTVILSNSSNTDFQMKLIEAYYNDTGVR